MRFGRVLMIGVLAGWGSAACSDGGGEEWGGTMTDSAGIVVVHNTGDEDWSLVAQPVVTEELSLGELDGAAELQFGQIAAIDVAPDGTMYVLDQQAAQVRVFDATGEFVRTVGKPGNGPGELSPGTAGLLVGDGDTLHVADMMRQRIQRYGPDGEDAGGAPVPFAEGIPIVWSITPERQFVTQVRVMRMPGTPDAAAPRAPRDWLLLRDASGTVVDTLIGLESGQTLDFSGDAPRMRLFSSEPVWALLSDGSLVHGRNDGYRLEVVDAAGTVERVVTRPFGREAVTESDREGLRRLMREAMQQQAQAPPAAIEQFISSIEFADHYPAYARILGGPGNTIWVQHIRTAAMAEREGRTFDPQDIGAPEWDVFDREGRFLGVLTMPPRFQPLRVVDDRVYGVQRDELDVQHVVRLRVTGLGTAQDSMEEQ